MNLNSRQVTRRTSGRRQFTRPMMMQVAAVCYRRSELSVEFLLINTSAGKWTFPKGRIAPEMPPCQAAEQEALEEAGAIGNVEESCLGHYLDLKRALGHMNRSREILIAAYLLEVETMSVAQEAGRNPTWFTPEEAKQRLAEQRAPKYSREFARIVDAAETAIRNSAFSTAQSPRMARPQEFLSDADSLDGLDTL